VTDGPSTAPEAALRETNCIGYVPSVTLTVVCHPHRGRHPHRGPKQLSVKRTVSVTFRLSPSPCHPHRVTLTVSSPSPCHPLSPSPSTLTVRHPHRHVPSVTLTVTLTVLSPSPVTLTSGFLPDFLDEKAFVPVQTSSILGPVAKTTISS
jgi:hypothetical protein